MGATVESAASAGRNRASKPTSKVTPRVRTELELLGEISGKLDRVVAVLAAQHKPRDIQIAILTAAGCDSEFIATMVGVSAGHVRKVRSRRPGAADPSANGVGASEAVAP